MLYVLKRLALILLGYVLASLASGAVAGTIFNWAVDLRVSPNEVWQFFDISVVLIATLLIMMYAALPATLVVLFGEIMAIRRVRYYAIAGCLIGAVLPLMAGIIMLIPVGIAFGPVAGFVYWGIAGRYANLLAAQATIPSEPPAAS